MLAELLNLSETEFWVAVTAVLEKERLLNENISLENRHKRMKLESKFLKRGF